MQQDIYQIIDEEDFTSKPDFELAEAEWELQKIASNWKDAPFIKEFINHEVW